ncbi:MAG TPA: hypothetical protein PLZ57_16185 [Pseudobdellovibrionaceae bacterium]|nr:hypothetical protein [Pseudobdellovibrionaceae bacterium]
MTQLLCEPHRLLLALRAADALPQSHALRLAKLEPDGSIAIETMANGYVRNIQVRPEESDRTKVNQNSAKFFATAVVNVLGVKHEVQSRVELRFEKLNEGRLVVNFQIPDSLSALIQPRAQAFIEKLAHQDLQDRLVEWHEANHRLIYDRSSNLNLESLVASALKVDWRGSPKVCEPGTAQPWHQQLSYLGLVFLAFSTPLMLILRAIWIG